MKSTLSTLSCLFLFNFIASAQEPAPPAPPKPHDYLAPLKKAVDNTEKLNGYRFVATVNTGKKAGGNPNIPVFNMGGTPKGKKITGSAHGDGLITFTADGTDFGATREGGGLIYYRTMADDETHTWRPRLGTNLTGSPLWWIPAPTHFLQEIKRLLPKVIVEKKKPKRIGLRHLTEFSIELTKGHAEDMLRSRQLPDPSKVPNVSGNGANILISSFGSGRDTVPDKLKYKISIWVDLSTKTIHKLQVKGTAKASRRMGGARVVVMGGPGGGRQVQNQPKDAPLKEVGLTIDFTHHGAPEDRIPYQKVIPRLGLKVTPLQPKKPAKKAL